jgi:hypothetical protein
MGFPIREAIVSSGEEHEMVSGERRYSDHDMKTAERIAGIEVTLRDHVIPALERIEANCRYARCFMQAPPVPATPSPATASEPAPVASSSAWFWGKVAGAVTVTLATVSALGVAAINKAPEVIAAISAFFHPPKQP